MADLTAQAYEVLGSQPPPGHELLSTVVLHLTPPGGTAATGAGVMFGAVGGLASGLAAEKRAQHLPRKPTKDSDARVIAKAQQQLGLCRAMVWGVNQHNLLVFKAGGVRQRTPVKLVARIPVHVVVFEGHHKSRLAVTIRGVPVEVAGETKPMTELAEVLRSVVGPRPSA